MTERPFHRLQEIEVLRAIAVLGVVLHHIRGNLFMAPHHLFDLVTSHLVYANGVDLFFAISGFVIARGLLPALAACDRARGFQSVTVAFWIRRAWRLLPSAWLWLAVILLASWIFNRSGVFDTVGVNLWATAAGVLDYANFRFADTFMRRAYGASFVWWSLSLEEQFYFLLPLLALAFRRFLPWMLLALWAVQFPLPRTPLLAMTRTDAILLGVLLAYWETHPSFDVAGRLLRRAPWPVRLATVAILFLALGVLGTWNTFWDRFDIGLTSLVCGVLVFLAAQNKSLLIAEGPARNIMVWLGGRSYGIYLVHIPVFFALRECMFRIGQPVGEWGLAGVAICLILLLAEANWRFVERPSRRYGARLAERWRGDGR
jgi:peptidoglycan/LPS O-acetylase OafA/YrhL